MGIICATTDTSVYPIKSCFPSSLQSDQRPESVSECEVAARVIDGGAEAVRWR
jgi:hypothetical protein